MGTDTLASRGVLVLDNSSNPAPVSVAAQLSPRQPPPPPPQTQASQARRGNGQSVVQIPAGQPHQKPQMGYSQVHTAQVKASPAMLAQGQMRGQAQLGVASPQYQLDMRQQNRPMDTDLARAIEISHLRTPSDSRFEPTTELDARDSLSEFAIFRFEKLRDTRDLDIDNLSSRPKWEVAQKTEIFDISKEDATDFVRQLDRHGKRVAEAKADLPPALQRQVELAHKALSEEEGEPHVFRWTLAQLHSDKRRMGGGGSGEYFVSRNYRDEIRMFTARPSFSASRERRRSRHGRKERVSLTAYFKRVVRPEVSALQVLEQRRQLVLMQQRQAARNMAMSQQQAHQVRFNEQLQRPQQALPARQMTQMEAQQQQMRAIAAANQQQDQQQQLQQMRAIAAANQQQQQAQNIQQRSQQQIPPPPGAGVQQQMRQAQGMQQGTPQSMPQQANRGVPTSPTQSTNQGQGPPRAPMPPQNKTRPGSQGQQRPQEQARQQQRRPSTSTQTQQGRNRAYSNGQASPRSSQYSIESDEGSDCDTIETPGSSVSSESRAPRRDRRQSRSRSRNPRQARERPEDYGFEPIRRASRTDKSYILENTSSPRVSRRRDSQSEHSISYGEIESLRQEAYDAGVADRRAQARGLEGRVADDLVFRPRASLPPRVLQSQSSVRLVHPPRLDEIEFERLRLEDEFEWRRANAEQERREWEEEQGRRRYEEDMRRRRQMESHMRTPMEEEWAAPARMREERVAEEYMRGRERSPTEFENPFGPFDRGRRPTVFSQR